MENIVGTLKQQHRELAQQLEITAIAAKQAKPSGVTISRYLKIFDILLKAHLAIEDGIFYPQILEKMRSKNMPTSGTEEFLKLMGVIAKDIHEFLTKYEEPSVIENNVETFKQDLEGISAALATRISSEEEGVYIYWNL